MKLIRISIFAFVIGITIPLAAMERPASLGSLTQNTLLGELPRELRGELGKYLDYIIKHNPAVAFWAIKAQLAKHGGKIPFNTIAQNAQSTINSIAWNPQGTLIAGLTNIGIQIWKSTGNLIASIPTPRIYSVTWNPQGTQIAGGSTHEVQIWNAQTGALIHTLTGHTQIINSVAWNSQGTLIASGSFDGNINIWDAHTGNLIRTLTNTSSVFSIAWNPEGNQIAAAGIGPKINIWDIKTGALIQTLSSNTHINSIAWNPHNSQIVAVSNNSIEVWDTQNGKLLQRIDTGHIIRITGRTNIVDSVAWSPQGTFIVGGLHDFTIKIWDALTGRLICTLPGHTSLVNSVAWNPNGTQIASTSYDATIKIWTLIDPAMINALTIDNMSVLTRAYDAWQHNKAFTISEEELSALPKDFQEVITKELLSTKRRWWTAIGSALENWGVMQ